MKVLVTGHRGYVGAHLVALLKEAGHRVPGYDLELFPSCEWEAAARPDVEPIADVRSLTARPAGGLRRPSAISPPSPTTRWATSTRR
jgi:nucleoside-diphosphate-sugar epimerase